MNGMPALARHATVAQIDEFDALLDVRSPAEFADDHVPGAENFPVLDDEERARVGTIYARDSPFAARRLGAALVARNVARHIEENFIARPKDWRPLVYCWRGGQRSAAMVTVLSQVGWPARQLEGGYRAFRRQVIADLPELAGRHRFVVLSGPTGSGKTALVEALAQAGKQVLDLEALAQHRGSVLGALALADAGQPGQKTFETAIWNALRMCDAARPVFVESESRRIGRLSIPTPLFEALIDSPCIRIQASLEARVAHLLERYRDVYADRAALLERLAFFVPQHGNETVERWRVYVHVGDFATLAREMVQTHYDPAYRRGGDALYRRAREAKVLELDSLAREAVVRATREIGALSETGNAT